jgi:hypothetical protein
LLANDTDVDTGTSLTAVLVPDSGPTNAQSFALYSDGSFTYAPTAGFTGTDIFSYTASDGNGGTDTATVSIDVSAVTPNALYVYDIRFESKRGNKDWRAVFEIRSDSNNDGVGGPTDEVAEGVEITVEFAGQSYTGFTDSDGVFRCGWIKDLGSGSHYAEVVDLVLTGFVWDPLTLDLEDDSDGDGLPDDILLR